MIETQELVLVQQTSEKIDKKPRTTKWKGEPMIRNHSIRASVKEILKVSEALDVVKVGIIGEPSTGKTTLANSIAHLCHEMSDVPFAYRVFGKEQFLNMKETLESLSPVNYILYFHDLSFLTANASKKQIEQVKQIVTEIRHLREDVKIILIYDYHYTMGLDKYLRQANFRYFTSIGTSETDNVIKLVGTRYTRRINEFQQMFVLMTTKHKARFRLRENTFFFYPYKNPFVPALFWNGRSLRYVVFPKREWIDKVCYTCSKGNGESVKSEINLDKFKEDMNKKFGPQVFEAALKLALYCNGINVYKPNFVRAQRFLSKVLASNMVDLETLFRKYQMTVTKTKDKTKMDGLSFK